MAKHVYRRSTVIKRLIGKGLTEEQASRLEEYWHDQAWSKSLETDDCFHNACDHNPRVYRDIYNDLVDEYFAPEE